MRKFFHKFRFLIVAFLVIGITSFSLVDAKNENKGVEKTPFSQVIDRLDLLIEKILENKKIQTQEKKTTTAETSLQNVLTYVNGDCFNGYESWQNSTHMDSEAPWSTAFIPDKGQYQESLNRLMDVNGDGLLDYAYLKHNYYNTWDTFGCHRGSYDTEVVDGQHRPKHTCYLNSDGVMDGTSFNFPPEACVYLNNGNGWAPKYRCKVGFPQKRREYVNNNVYYYYQMTFYGDCADTSN